MKKRFTDFNYPLLSGLLIGAAGGTIGTLIYNSIRDTKLWSRFNFIFDYALKLVNMSYKLPLFLVIALLVSVVVMVFFFLAKATRANLKS